MNIDDHLIFEAFESEDFLIPDMYGFSLERSTFNKLKSAKLVHFIADSIPPHYTLNCNNDIEFWMDYDSQHLFIGYKFTRQLGIHKHYVEHLIRVQIKQAETILSSLKNKNNLKLDI